MLTKNFTRSLGAAASANSGSASFDVAERTVDVGILTASGFDPGAVLSWVIVGGADAALFTVDPVTGLLRFVSAQNFVTPADAGADNVYDVVVRATDGTLVSDQNIAVTILDGPDQYTGTAGNDIFIAPDASNWTISGLDGNDTLTGNSGNDTILGGTGDDTLYGEGGNDTLDGGTPENFDNAGYLVPGGLTGILRLVSGTGVDAGKAIVERVDGATVERLFIITHAGDGSATVEGVNAAVSFGTDTATNIDQLIFGLAGVPTLGARLSVNVGAFNAAATPTASYVGTISSDTLDASVAYPGVLTTQAVNLFGLLGNDTLIGHAGNNYMEGGNDDDTLTGGAGFDNAGFGLLFGTPGVLRAFDGAGTDAAAKLIMRLDGNGQVIEQVARVAANPDGTVTVTSFGSASFLGTDTLAGFEAVNFFISGGAVGSNASFRVDVSIVINSPTVSTVNGSALGDSIDLALRFPAADASVLLQVNGNGGNDTIIGRSTPGTDNANYFNGSGTGSFVWSVADGAGADVGKLLISRTSGTITETLFRLAPLAIGAATVESLGAQVALTGIDSVTNIENLNFNGGGSSNIGTSVRLVASVGAISGSFAQVNGSVLGETLDLNALYAGNPTLNANINADRGDDTLIGNAGGNYLEGGIGNDSIDGGSENDSAGYRLPAGLGGTLRAVAGTGADAGLYFVERVDGGIVEQLLRIEKSGASIIVTGLGSLAGLGTDTLVNTERLDVAFANNVGQIFVNVTPLAFPAQNGFGNIEGSVFSDTINVAPYYPDASPTGSTYVNGADGDDSILGNTLAGFMEGAAGNDAIDGGGGDDTAAFTLAAGTPGILQVVAGSGIDAGRSIVQRVDGGVIEDVFRITHMGSGSATIEALNSAAGLGTDTVSRIGGLVFRIQNGPETWLQIGPNSFQEGANATWASNGSRFDDVIDVNVLRPGLPAGTGFRIYADAGNDTIIGGSGNDNISGNAGTDVVIYSGDRASYTITRDAQTASITVTDNRPGAPDGSDTINGYDVETLRFSDGDVTTASIGAVITGTAGNDRLDGTPGADIMDGLGGDDNFFGAGGDDTITGGAGNDYIGGAGGDDVAVYSGNRADYTITFIAGGSALVRDDRPGSPDGNDYLDGTTDRLQFADQLLVLPGSPGLQIGPEDYNQPATLTGSAGDDNIGGTALGDTLDGADGDDVIFAAEGDDTVIGGNGDDNLTGWDGNDTLTGGAGADLLQGNDGDDILIGAFTPDIGAQPGDLGDVLFGGAGNDTFFGGGGDDQLFGDSGNDDLRADAGSDQIDGGEGSDLVSYRFNEFTVGRTLDYTNFAATNNFTWNDGRGGLDQVSNVEALFLAGTQAADTIVGSQFATPFGQTGFANNLNGQGGNDSITGANQRDRLGGGGGDDSLFGLGGDDDLAGGAGTDSIDGGNGTDTAILTGTATDYTIIRLPGGAIQISDLRPGSPDGTDILTNVEQLSFTGGGVTATYDITNTIGDDNDEGLFGGGENDLIVGNGGNDYTRGNGGTDLVLGGSGRDTTAFGLPVGTPGTLRTIDGASQQQILVQHIVGGVAETIAQVDFAADGSTATIVGLGSQAARFGTVTVQNVEQLDFFIEQAGGGQIPNNQYVGVNFYTYVGPLIFNAAENRDIGVVGGSELADTINVEALYPGVSAAARVDVYAGRGNDIITGHAGDSFIRGDGGSDSIDGGAGTDYVQFMLVAGTIGSLRVIDDPANAGQLLVQLIDGAVVTDLYRVNVTASGAATVTGLGSLAGQGTDTVTNAEALHFFVDQNSGGQFAGINLVVQASPGSTPPYAGGSEAPDVINLEALFGSGNSNAGGNRGNDTIIGSAGTNYIVGGGGNDSIDGAGGYDAAQFMLPFGTTGTLQVVDDLANPGKLLVQLVSGGVTTDLYRVTPISTGSATVEALGNLGLQGTDTVSNIEELQFFVENTNNGPFTNIDLAVRLNPGSSPPFAAGSVVDDAIDLGALFGAGASNANGNRGNDTIIGSAGNNNIIGGVGNDTLLGMGGDDSFEGEAGNDSIDGGSGTDFIRYVLPTGTTGTFSVVDGALPDTYIVRRTLPAGAGTEDIATISVAVDRTATVTGFGIAAFIGTDTVTNVERLEFFVNGGSFTSLNFGTTAFPANGPNAAFIQGGIFDDSINAVSFFPAADANTRININADRGNDVVTGHAGANNIQGGAGDDTILGLGGIDQLTGGAGSDTIDGGDGNDTLIGAFNTGFGPQPGDGADVLRGGAGNDIIRGGDGDDQLFGDDGDDNLRGDAGSDLMDGGAGRDFASYFFSAATAGLTADFSGYTPGVDFLFVDPLGGTDTIRNIETLGIGGSNFDDVLYGSEFVISSGGAIAGVDRAPANQMSGNAGNDSLTGGADFDFLTGGTGNDFLDGRGGFDMAIYSFGATDEITGAPLTATGVNFSAAAMTTPGAAVQIDAGVLGIDTLVGIEAFQVNGTNFNDILAGSGGNDLYFGGAGNDSINGLAGDDYLDGGTGNDAIDGGTGNDTVFLTSVRTDYDIVRLLDGSVRVTDLRQTGTTDGQDTLTSVESLRFIDGTTVTVSAATIGTESNDLLVGTAGDDSIYGGLGDDYLRGGDGNDLLIGGAGNDSFDESTTANGDDIIDGGDGNDQIVDFRGTNILRGGNGNDLIGGTGTLYGGAGNDTFIYVASGSSADTLYGEGGADVFIIIPVEANFALDRIADFDVSSDQIAVQFLVDEMIGWTGGFAFQMFQQGYLRIVQNGTDATLQFDRDGSAGGGFGFADQVVLSNQGATALSALQNRVTLYASSSAGTVGANIINGSNADDPALRGHGGDDVINGLGGTDFIEGGLGNDQLSGGDGNDNIQGDYAEKIEGGDDIITGGAGNDSLFGSAGNDNIDGGADNDLINGGTGRDVLTGGTGADIFVLEPSAGTMLALTDHISDFSVAQGDRLQLGPGLGFADLTIVNDNGSAVISITATGAYLAVLANVDAATLTPAQFTAQSGVSTPADADPAANSVAEGATLARPVGLTVVATAATGPNPTYSLSDSANGRFVIDSVTGVVSTGAALDAEQAASYTITVFALGANGAFASQVFTIAVTDVNEFAVSAPADVDTALNQISENAAIGSSVGITVSASDADATTNSVTYSLSNDAGGRFVINAATGAVTTSAVLDAEQAASHTITIVATSADGSATSADFTIAVTDLNEAPVITSGGGGAAAAVQIAERTTAVATLTAADPDTGATVTWSISGGADAALFTIDAATGALSFNTAPQFAAPADAGGDNVYDIVVRASDGSLFDEQALAITVTDSAESFTGTAGNDVFAASDSSDWTLSGLGGNDTLTGNSGDDTILGGTGDDVLAGSAGNDVIDGGDGRDTASYRTAAGGVTVNLALAAAQITGGDGTDTLSSIEDLIGSDSGDRLTGDAGSNTVEGGAGDDTLDGSGGVDTLSYASAAAGITVTLATTLAQATGGAGTDTVRNFENILGSAFDDTLTGNSSTNLIDGGAGDDMLDGNTGTDTVSYASAAAAINVSLALQGAAQDSGGGGIDTLVNFENLTGSAYDDMLAGNAVNNVIDGGDGIDTVSYAAAAAGITVGLGIASAQNTGGAGSDTLRNIENLVGSAFNDTLSGDAGDNILAGGDGIDIITYARAAAGVVVNLGLQGSDQSTTGAGIDLLTGFENLTGSAFDDNLAGDGGDNVLDGGLGFDTLSYADAAAGVTVSLALTTAQNTIGAGIDTIRAFERLAGSAFGDVLTGSSGANLLAGGEGDDSLDGSGGNDDVDGEGGDDVLIGGVGDDILRGGSGTDTASYATSQGVTVDLALIGVQNTIGAGFDQLLDIENLLGSTRADTLSGDAGANILDGNAGTDTVSYATAAAAVTVSLGLQGAAQDTGGGGIDTLLNFENLTGSAFDDLLAGNANANIIDGGDGTDTVSYAAALAGVIAGLGIAAAQNTVGAGSDTLRNVENLIGSAFNDTLSGDAGDNALAGSDGIDTVTYARAAAGVTVSLGLQGSDQNTLGGGVDLLTGFENLTGSAFDDMLAGDGGDNALDGGLGIDTLSYADAAAGVSVSLALTTAQNTIGAGTDSIRGFERLTGSAFNDVLAGSTAANVLIGGDGNDSLDGSSGDDDLDGEDGDDVLIGGVGNDTLRGGAGIDTASYATSLGVTVDLSLIGVQNSIGAGFDQMIDIENLLGSTRTDTLSGDAGANILDGNAGTDTVSYATAAAAVIVSLGLQGAAQDTGGAGLDTLLNFENLTGSAFDDTLAGNAVTNIIDGGDGIDTVTYAAAAAGVTVGLGIATAQATVGAGNDTLRNIENLTGSAFNDRLSGDAGDNSLDGGLGIDTVTYARAATGVTVSLVLQGGDQDTIGNGFDFLTGFENLTGSAFDDTLSGDAGNNALDGGLGIDTLSYAGASAGVTISLASTAAQNTIGAGTDTIRGFERLTGSAFGDVLTGSSAANVLTGGAGGDRMTGGSGADVFRFESLGDFGTGASLDRIVDFSRVQGDKIDLAAIDANAGLDGDQAFAFIGNTAFSGQAGELRYSQVGSVFSISGDTDGDGLADFTFEVTGAGLTPIQPVDLLL